MTTVTLKKSSVSNKAPITTDLQYGELALNYADGRLYYKTAANTIDYFLAGGGVGDTTTTVYNYAGITVDTFVGDGTTTTFALTSTPSSINYLLVNVGGTFQPRSVYAVQGQNILFSSAPPDGAVIEVTTIASIDQVSTSVSWNDITDKPVIPTEYVLPAASETTLGGIKIGTGLSIDVNNVVSAFSGSYTDLTDKPSSLTLSELITSSTTETIQNKGIASSVVPVSYTLGNVAYFSSITSDFTLNFTNVSAVTETSIVFVIIVNQGNTTYIPNAVQIDGTAKAINWSNSSTPVPVVNGLKVYTFTLLNLGSVWSVLGQMSEFGV